MRPLKTLVVDDSLSILKLIATMLEGMGVKHCDFAMSGEAAIELISEQNHHYDVMLIDLNMPNVDGMQFMQFLAGYRFSGSIVIISALDKRVINMAASLASEYGLKLAGCIEKPIDAESLTSIIERIADSGITRKFAPKEELLSLDEVRDAIHHDHIAAYYQPKVDLKNNRVKGLEALARIVLANSTCVPACRFIPVVESNRLNSELLAKVLEQTILEAPILLTEFGDDMTIALNISPLDLYNSQLPDQIHNALKKHHLNPKNFVIEVTESVAIEDPVQIDTLSRIRIKGLGLSLDDFGTGYTNINQLRDLPYTEVKLDRSLVHNINIDKLSQVISDSLFDIFSELTLDVVVEGIETQLDIDYFENIAYPMTFQGYAISKPKIFQDILSWHRNWKRVVKSRCG